MLGRVRWRMAMLLVPMAIMVGSTLAAIVTSAPAGAAGYLPPSNPPANIAPSSGDWLASINAARAQEGVGPMNISESQLAGLPIDEQVLTVVNDERVDRGLPPINYVTSQLDSYAQGGANVGQRPVVPLELERGRTPHVRRRGVGRRPHVGARGRLLLDVRRRVERLVDDERRVRRDVGLGVLGAP